MSTRAVIAKVDGDGWKGRYHHWDGYPEALGKTLHEARDRYFGGDIDALIKRLIDDEPVGWSTINSRDLGKPSVWEDVSVVVSEETPPGPQSYSVRGETPFSDDPTGDWITHDGDDGGADWAYVLSKQGIVVLERRHDYPPEEASDTFGGYWWKYLALVPWEAETEQVPWEDLEVWDTIWADIKAGA